MNKPHLVAHYMSGFFHRYLAVIRGVSSLTIFAYRDAFKLLLRFAADGAHKHVDDLTLEDLDDQRVLAFLDYVEKGRKCSTRTRNARLAAISTFFNFVAREEPSLLPMCHRIRGIPRKRDQHRTIDYLDESEIRAILNCVDVHARMGFRDRALLLFLFNTGARAQETVDLTIDSLRLDANGQVKLLGKGRRERTCPLWPETVQLIVDYLANRHPINPNEGRLFLNASGQPLTRFGVRHLVQQHVAAATMKCRTLGNKTVGPHTFRHSTAMHLIRSGNDVNLVSYWLGHADINSTHMYVEIDMEMKRKMLEKSPCPPVKGAPRTWRHPSVLKWLDDISAKNYVQSGDSKTK